MAAPEEESVDTVLESLRAHKNDYLRVATNKTLVKYLHRANKEALESVEFSDSVLKINKRGKVSFQRFLCFGAVHDSGSPNSLAFCFCLFCVGCFSMCMNDILNQYTHL
jgi:hypothetical protein